MNHDHYYVYLYGSIRELDVSLDGIAKKAAYAPDHLILMKHHEQLDEMRGLSLMYGVELKVDTWKNWQECNRFRKFQKGAKPIRLPALVMSNYRLPNIMGM